MRNTFLTTIIIYLNRKLVFMISTMQFCGATAQVLENNMLRAVILPEHGGKVASLYYKEKSFEFLFQNPKDSFQSAPLGASFAAHEACGFDDTFPSIDAEKLYINGKEIDYPDHGEVWTSACTVTQQGDALTLSFQSKILPYRYERTFTLTEHALQIAYRITNNGSDTFPCLWTMHGLATYRPDMRLLYPACNGQIETVCVTTELGEKGTLHAFPLAQNADGAVYDCTRVPAPTPASRQKFYLTGKVAKGECGYEYPTEQVRVTISYDETILPYLGFWITAGAFRGDYNCALEPTNGYFDSITCAQKNNACPTLSPGETLSFSVEIALHACNV